MQELNKTETNIITVEDPIEMNIEGMNQVQVNSEIGLDFATVLRSILRQDPNIILIGEIRDSETAKIAVRASITGHLVLSTIHTNNSLSTIERLLDMDVERYLLSSAMTGIISQRLAKMLCPKCKVKRETTPYEKKIFKKALNLDVESLYDANEKGCSECHNGYKGRIAVQEVLEIDDEMRDALNDENLEKDDLRRLVYTSNVTTLLQDGLHKVLNEQTTFEEIYRIIDIDSDSNEVYSIEQTNNINSKEDNKKDITQETSSTTSPSPVKEETIIQIPTIPKQNPIQNQSVTPPNQNQNEQPSIMSSSPIAKETASTPVITSSVKSALGLMQQSNKNNQPQIINQTKAEPQLEKQQPTVPQPQIINNA